VRRLDPDAVRHMVAPPSPTSRAILQPQVRSVSRLRTFFSPGRAAQQVAQGVSDRQKCP